MVIFFEQFHASFCCVIYNRQNLTHSLVTSGQHQFLTTVDFNIYLDNASDNHTSQFLTFFLLYLN